MTITSNVTFKKKKMKAVSFIFQLYCELKSRTTVKGYLESLPHHWSCPQGHKKNAYPVKVPHSRQQDHLGTFRRSIK